MEAPRCLALVVVYPPREYDDIAERVASLVNKWGVRPLLVLAAAPTGPTGRNASAAEEHSFLVESLSSFSSLYSSVLLESSNQQTSYEILG